MGEREGGAIVQGDLDNDGPVVRDREEEFSLEGLDMLRVIGTGTFARVCLCQVSEKVSFETKVILSFRTKEPATIMP